MANEFSSEMKVELLKLTSQLVLSCGDMQTTGGPRMAAHQLGILKTSHDITLLSVLDAVYDHLVDKVGK